MKIIFLIDSTFSKRDYDRFGCDIFYKHKVDLCLWDFRKINLREDSSDSYEKNIDLTRFKALSNFNELHTNNNLDGVFIVDFRLKTYKKHSTSWFRDNGAIIVTLEQGIMPLSLWDPILIDQLIVIRNKILKHGLTKVIGGYYRKFFIQPLEIKISDIKVCSGSASKCSNREFEIRSHAFDYDIFLKEKDRKRSGRSYVLFLDNGMTNHPDYIKLNLSPYCTDEVYFPLLNSFFDKVEESTGLPVIIALHPRIINNKSNSVKFGNREIITGKTAELVKDAKLILNHDSSSVNFVALWKVPMIFITTDQIEKALYPEMESQDQFLQTKRLNINHPYNDMNFFEIAKKPISQYNHFIEKFIKVNDTPSQHSAEILIQGLKKYVQ